METCSNCGAVARPGAKFCTICGSRLSTPDAPASAPGWQQSPTPTTSVSSDNQDTTIASASENEATLANTSGETSTDASAPSSWSWGSSTDTAATGKDVTASSESSAESVKPVESGSGADETGASTSSSTTTSTTSPSWSWRSSTNGADDSDSVASGHDHEDAATADTSVGAQEGANRNADQDAVARVNSESSVTDEVSSPLADVTSSAGDSTTDTASTSTWSWGESSSAPEHDASGSSGVESTGAASDVKDANAEVVNAHEAPAPDISDEDRTSEPETPRATGSETNGDRASSDVDVSSAFKDDTDTEGEETLSSWAARWNETEGGADSGAGADATAEAAPQDSASMDTATTSTDTSDSPATDAGTDFTELSPLEGAPGGQQSATDESARDTETQPATTPDYGIEGAPGGQFPKDDPTATDTGTDPDVSVVPAHEREEAYRDQTFAADDIGSTGSGSGDERATTATDDLIDDEGTTAAANEPVDEPSGAHGSEVTPGTDADLVNPLVGMDVSPTTTATATTTTGQEPDSTGIADERASDSTAGNARDRAEQLIDELRGLLPTLALSGSTASGGSDSGAGANVAAGSVAGTGTGPNLQPVIDELTAARPQAGSFDDLRTALEKARTNPRDVDTMLDLVGRVDDLIALLDSQDRLNDAAGHAIDQLRQAETPTAD